MHGSVLAGFEKLTLDHQNLRRPISSIVLGKSGWSIRTKETNRTQDCCTSHHLDKRHRESLLRLRDRLHAEDLKSGDRIARPATTGRARGTGRERNLSRGNWKDTALHTPPCQ